MKALSNSNTYKIRYESLITIVIGLTFGTTLAIASKLDFKWLILCVFLLIALSVFLIFEEKQKIMFFLLVFVMPISLDFYPVFYGDLPYRLPINGFRITLFDIIFFYLFTAWLIRLSRKPNLKIRFYLPIFIPFASIFFLAILSLINSPIPIGIKLAYLWYSFQNLLVFLYVINNINERKTIILLVAALLFSGVLQSLIGFGQYTTGSTFGFGIFGETEKGYWTMKVGKGFVNRVSAILGHPNRLSSFLGFLMPINLALIIAPIKKKYKILLIFSFAIMFVVNIMTFSRGGWISFAISGGVTLYWCLKKRIKQHILIGFLIIGLYGFATLSAITFVEPIRNRLLETDYGSLSVRKPLAELSFNMILDNPIIGVGLGSFNAAAHQYDNTRHMISYSFPAPVHNEFLLIASEVGLPALILVIVILIVTFKNLIKIMKIEYHPIITFLAIGFFCSWLGWCIHRMIAYDYILIHYYPCIILGIIQSMLIVSQKNQKADSRLLKKADKNS